LHLTDEEAALTEYRGAYSTFKGSPASEGQLQFDLWNARPYGMWDWDALKNDIKKWGIRNSLLLAPMPTASTSQILGFNESFEPFTSNIYQRRTLAGEFTVINRYLIRDLINLGIWSVDLKNRILLGNGSIQHIQEIPQTIRDLYKTAWELKQRVLIDQSADRGIYVCQSQSLNLFVEDPEFAKLSNMHFYAWKKGLKTGMYYLRTRPKAKTMAFSIEATAITSGGGSSNMQTHSPRSDEVAFACRRDDPSCTMCSS
jgi:ribonucleoside-diphosphate reductase alpha chain